MMRLRSTRRARPSRRIWLAVLVSTLFVAPVAGAAQVRPDTIPRDTLPRDTVPGDTLIVPIPPEEMARDTLPADSVLAPVPDSMIPAPRLPAFPQPFPRGFAYARWEWDRAELLRFHGLSLLELLEQVPGLLITRSGGFGRPAGIGFLSGGGGVVRVFRDGFEVDPLTSAALDLQEIGLVDLQAVRVHRTPAEIRVELETFELEDSRAYSMVEAATGNFEAKFLRALFSRVVGSRSTVTGAFDLTSTDGFTRNEPFSFSSGRLRWTYALSERAGLQAEYRFASVEREPSLQRFPADSVFREDAERTELVLRGRAEPIPGLTVDGVLARVSRVPADSGSQVQAGGGSGRGRDPFGVELASTQAMLRAGYLRDFGFVEAAARLRGGDVAGRLLPSADLSARGAFRPLPWMYVEGGAHTARTDDGQATRLTAAGRVGPLRGLSLFASASAGERWAGTVRDTAEITVGEDTVFVGGFPQLEADTLVRPLFGGVRADAAGLRAGAEWSGRGMRLGAAFLSSAPTIVAPYGLAFDRGIRPPSVGAASGVEAYGSVPLPFWWPALRLEGWYVNWLETGNRPYLPLEQAKLALEFHGVFVEGEFEPTLRLETVYRGSSLAPSLDRTGFGQASEAYTLANLFLQIRILDLRAFFIFENLLNNRAAADVPGLGLAGPRTLYGIRWHFRN